MGKSLKFCARSNQKYFHMRICTKRNSSLEEFCSFEIWIRSFSKSFEFCGSETTSRKLRDNFVHSSGNKTKSTAEWVGSYRIVFHVLISYSSREISKTFLHFIDYHSLCYFKILFPRLKLFSSLSWDLEQKNGCWDYSKILHNFNES